ncbi:MAG: tRNA (N6-isopentenyl adenosine(37)-C2)-methylthiotransferase MiaB [Bacteroidetes bacterium]|nr:tRNA (N6-isopentenyl adenosine(37)-C2)-methylthiotransferase MiaB [Bacteroidota bacterium]
MNNVYIETFGCEMNKNDTNIIKSIMLKEGFNIVSQFENANAILINTCSIRENAEKNIQNRINYLYSVANSSKNDNNKVIIGMLGCMAVQLGEKMFKSSKKIDLFVGPDGYSNLPSLVNECLAGAKKLDIDFKKKEHYDKIETYIDKKEIYAAVTIIRGCNNFCSYCVVPNVRGREKCKDFNSILKEVDDIVKKGAKSITLLGQNVNSYQQDDINFPKLLEEVAKRNQNVRISFLTSHPKDFSLELVNVMKMYNNICNYIHLPVQSGSDRVLQDMNRKYTINTYISLINSIRAELPDVSITTDIIAGYPGETLEDHQATLDLMSLVRFDSAFMFMYSARQGTPAFNRRDDVNNVEKKRRLNEIIALQSKISAKNNQSEVGKIISVLIEGKSKKYANQLVGRSLNNKVVAFEYGGSSARVGDVVNVFVEIATSKTLIGRQTN